MVYIYGCGGHAKVLLDILTNRYPELRVRANLTFIDDNREGDFLGYPIVKLENVAPIARIYLAIGDNKFRQKAYYRRMGLGPECRKTIFPKLQHYTSRVADTPGAPVILREGTQLLNHTYVGPDTVVGSFTIVNNGASVDHDCHLGDFVHVAPGARLCGGVNVGNGTLIGAGSVVIPKMGIGYNCVIGAGSVVVSDIPDNCVAYGNPCRVVKELPPEW